MFFDCFYSIMRTSRGIPAISTKQWRNTVLIELDQQNKKFTYNAFHIPQVYSQSTFLAVHLLFQMLASH